MWVAGPHEFPEIEIPVEFVLSPQLTVMVSPETELDTVPDAETAFTFHFGEVLFTLLIVTSGALVTTKFAEEVLPFVSFAEIR